MSVHWYDRDHNEISVEQAEELLKNGEARQIVVTDYVSKEGPVRISTVFLVLDHNWDPDGPPLLYETMVFGGERDGDMYRYPTAEQALAHHDQLVAEMKHQDLAKSEQ